MWINAIVSYLHYLSFMLCFGALLLEAHNIKKELSLSEAWIIVISDAVYGISATMVLITGILRVLYFGKGTDYYLSNSVFYIKVAVFLMVGLASVYPTISFIAWLTELQQGQIPKLELAKLKRLKWLMKIELAGLIIIPLLATIMARGIGGI